MKFYKFLGGNTDELIFEDANLRFLVHKSLINENTKAMIQRFIVSLKTPAGVRTYPLNGIYIFEPEEYEGGSYLDSREDYLWFAL